jgi:hypothetical protein
MSLTKVDWSFIPMKTLIPQFLSMAVSGTIFITISSKLGWSKKLWSLINRRLNPIYNATVWIVFAAILHVSIQMVCGSLGITDSRIITGALIGFYFAFIPNLGAKKDK